eukprot:534623-Pleurochrysis_carterae.AAC.2
MSFEESLAASRSVSPTAIAGEGEQKAQDADAAEKRNCFTRGIRRIASSCSIVSRPDEQMPPLLLPVSLLAGFRQRDNTEGRRLARASPSSASRCASVEWGEAMGARSLQ